MATAKAHGLPGVCVPAILRVIKCTVMAVVSVKQILNINIYLIIKWRNINS
jgi:hypothetical protein